MKMYVFLDDGESIITFAENEEDAFAFALNVNEELRFAESYYDCFDIEEGETIRL